MTDLHDSGSLQTKEGHPAPHPEIRAFLADPVGLVSLAELPAFWTVRRITFVYKRPPDLQGGIRLVAAFRGALGRSLKAVSRERLGQAAVLGTAFQALFADHLDHGDGWFVPKPYVIWITTADERIFVELSLLGEARCYMDDVIEAVLRIMLPAERGGEGGISLSEDGKHRRRWDLLDLFWRERAQFLAPPAPHRFTLETITPVITSPTGAARSAMGRLLFSIFARVIGLARWNGLAVAPANGLPACQRACDQIGAHPLFEPKIDVSVRRSRSFGHMQRVETGISMSLDIFDYERWLWPGFVLGTTSHMGHDVVQGYGRYALKPFAN